MEGTFGSNQLLFNNKLLFFQSINNTVRMGLPVQVSARYQYSEPIFGVVTPGIIQDTFLHMAMENERYLSELCDEAGCFKDTQIVGKNWP